MSKPFHSSMSAVRRNAETVLNQRRKQQDSLKQEQQKANEAMAEKTARLRALRLAKEGAEAAAAVEETVTSPIPAPKRQSVRRSKQT